MAASALIVGLEGALVAVLSTPNLEVAVGAAVEALQIGNLKTANPFWENH